MSKTESAVLSPFLGWLCASVWVCDERRGPTAAPCWLRHRRYEHQSGPPQQLGQREKTAKELCYIVLKHNFNQVKIESKFVR